MYAEWPSIEDEVLKKCSSVLHTYPPAVGRDVAKSIVNSLFSNTSNVFSSPSSNNSGISTVQGLKTHAQVKWTMEVICYSLTLPINEYETLKESVSLYTDWLSVVGTAKANVPEPIRSDPLPYVRMMISHLENLFIPKSEDSNLGKQLAMCLSVLRTIQTVAHDGSNFDRDTWESLLKFTLSVSTTLLTPPSFPNGLAEQMCEMLMQTLFDVWLLACHQSFPTPALWKTAQMLFSGLRHHPPVIEWWFKVTAALTSRLLSFIYGPDFPAFKAPEATAKLIPLTMTKETITQAWFRILHLINDPVELSSSAAFSKASIFNNMQLRNDMQMDFSTDYKMLPYIFLRAMKGVSSFVDAFLGLPTEKKFEVNYPAIFQQIANPITPTSVRKSGKAKKNSSTVNTPFTKNTPTSPGNNSSLTSGWSNQTSSLIDMHPQPTRNRPQCNSVLHLFGKWLFDAALAGCKFNSRRESGISDNRGRSGSIPYNATSTSSLSSSPFLVSPPGDNLVANPMFDSSEFPDSSEAGRAEACGTLCRLMCCKKTREHILPVYLSRFYLVLSHGLLGESKQVLASIIINSVDLMRIDLPGVTCLLPALLTALDGILPDKELQQFKPFLNTVTLRRAAIHLLISMLPLPLHYTSLKVEDIQELWSGIPNNLNENVEFNFQTLKQRLLDLLVGALQCEADPINTQIILGALLIALQDSALFEAAGADRDDSSSAAPTRPNNTSVDVAYGLYVKIIHLVSRKLDTWKSDLNISLAALELFSGLAKARIQLPDKNECKRAVHELCLYIVYQCERPPPQHKRELHSMIVTAFHTLATWLLEHPYLLEEKDCLHEVLEIIELGISGSKSVSVQTGSNQTTSVMKTQKELSPVSLRVMEAAEALLILVFEHVGAFPSPCSPSSMSSLLDERSLLFHTGSMDPSLISVLDDQCQYSMQKAASHFRYFGLYNGLLLSILEQNQKNQREPVPTVTVIIRNASGRKVWTMQLRQTPRSDKLTPESYLSRPCRPEPLTETKPYTRPEYRTYPKEVDKIPLVKADCSIPPLHEVPTREQAPMIEKLHHYIDIQKRYEDEVAKYVQENPEKIPECIPADPAQEFQSARLLLSQFNFLTLDSVKAKPHERNGPDLVMLDTSDPSFADDLETFDSIPTRNHNTVFVFYLKADQSDRDQILNNVSKDCLSIQPAFTEFLLSLGWPVDVRKHPGWSGRLSNSWKLKNDFNNVSAAESIDLSKNGPGVFNGKKYILYYADASTEMAFVVPSFDQTDNESTNRVETDSAVENLSERLRPSLDLSNSNSSPSKQEISTGTKTKQTSQSVSDTRLTVVWCEDYESFDNFSSEKLESEMITEEEIQLDSNKSKLSITTILIHPLESGLFRIHVCEPSCGKGVVAVPLVSGMVVSRRVLGVAVRTTAMNICSRRRLSKDSCSTPYVRRKQLIQELLSKYQRRITEPEFFTAIFTDKKSADENRLDSDTVSNANVAQKQSVSATS